MTSLSHTFSSGQTLNASNLNTVLAELLALSSGIRNSQVLGGLTADKLADRFACSWVSQQLVPNVGMAGGVLTMTGATSGTTLPGAAARAKLHQPIFKPGSDGFLCCAILSVATQDVGAPTDAFNWDLRLNATTVLGQQITCDQGDNILYAIGDVNGDPVANPLTAMQDGDFVESRLWVASGTPEPIGVELFLLYKGLLVS